MDFNGNPTGTGDNLSNGGQINGDLLITQDLDVSGEASFQDFTAVNGEVTGTLEVGTLVSDIITEDPLIHLAKSNPADLLNTGYFAEYNDGSLKFAGVIRSKDDKKFYVFEDLTTQPSGSTDITSLTRGDLVVKDFNSRNSVSEFGTSARALIINDNTGAPQYGFAYNPLQNKLELKDTDNDLIFDVNKATNDTTFYGNISIDNTLVPISRFDLGGTSYVHLIADDSDSGAGYTGRKARGSFTTPTPALQDDTACTLKGEGFNGFNHNVLGQIVIKANENQSLTSRGGRIELQTANNGNNPASTKITIDNEVKVEGRIVAFNSSNLSKYLFNETQFVMTRGDNQPQGLQMLGQKSRGTLSSPTPVLSQDTLLNLRGIAYNGNNYGTNGDIKILANEDQTPTNRGGKMVFETTNLGNDTPATKLTIDNKVKIENDLVIGNNTPGSSYTLPSVRGSSGQVLMDVNGDGNVSWQSEQASSHTLQQAFNVSGPSPQITTLPTFIPVFGIQSHLSNSVSDRFFELKESTGQEVFEVYSDGYIYGYSGLSLGGGPFLNAYNFPLTAGASESPLKLVGNNVIFEYGGYSQFSAITLPVGNTIENVVTTGNGAGSLTIPANSMRDGTCFHLVMNGVFRNQNNSANIRIRVKANGIIIGDSNIIDLDAVASLTAFEYELDIRFSTAGVSSLPLQGSQFTYYDNGYKGSMRNSALNSIDATIDNTISVTWQWSTQSLDNVAIVRMLRFTKEF